MMELDRIHTLIGIFDNNTFTSDDGTVIDCCTYGSVFRMIQGKHIIANFRYSNISKHWTIFQYIVL